MPKSVLNKKENGPYSILRRSCLEEADESLKAKIKYLNILDENLPTSIKLLYFRYQSLMFLYSFSVNKVVKTISDENIRLKNNNRCAVTDCKRHCILIKSKEHTTSIHIQKLMSSCFCQSVYWNGLSKNVSMPCVCSKACATFLRSKNVLSNVKKNKKYLSKAAKKVFFNLYLIDQTLLKIKKCYLNIHFKAKSQFLSHVNCDANWRNTICTTSNNKQSLSRAVRIISAFYRIVLINPQILQN